MLANFHTHTKFCDGKNTAEEVVLAAIKKGFSAIGFSGHGYTPYDLRYCMKDEKGYIAEITRLKAKYSKDIQICLGTEEDAFSPVERSKYEYIIGSSHYVERNGECYPIDSNRDYFEKCLKLYDYKPFDLAKDYYRKFCDYILSRKPDIIGHFDLITKFDEKYDDFFFGNKDYLTLAEDSAVKASKSGAVFEVNTGCIARGYRNTAFPSEHILNVLQKIGAKVMLSSDSHSIDTLDYNFDKTKVILKNIGFTHLYTINNGNFEKYEI